jgi:hypothetical protein
MAKEMTDSESYLSKFLRSVADVQQGICHVMHTTALASVSCLLLMHERLHVNRSNDMLFSNICNRSMCKFPSLV